ncbi:MAG: 30S ribosomal protein S16 [Verrucomicrobia bacterium]|nr:30S ribosomal protein S16 [Verrucomicrobiota bacterium]MBS0637801.1 30S ribosomal protein S16 [Verrucomicrobiota bacterium]
MALTIRLRSQGTTNRVMYRLVVTDSRSPRDGKYLEALGWYNPFGADDATRLCFKADRVQHWLNNGATISECAESLVKQTAPAIIKSLNERRLAAAAKRRKRRAGKKDATKAVATKKVAAKKK